MWNSDFSGNYYLGRNYAVNFINKQHFSLISPPLFQIIVGIISWLCGRVSLSSLPILNLVVVFLFLKIKTTRSVLWMPFMKKVRFSLGPLLVLVSRECIHCRIPLKRISYEAWLKRPVLTIDNNDNIKRDPNIVCIPVYFHNYHV